MEGEPNLFGVGEGIGEVDLLSIESKTGQLRVASENRGKAHEMT